MAYTGTISTYESGVDLAFEWKIEDFFNLPERDGACYYSSEFSFGGERWFLLIKPNGSIRNDSSGHVDLQLVKCGSDRFSRQSFSLSLKTGKGKKYNEQNCTKDFGRIYPKNYYELLRFIRRSELTMRKSELVPEGVLTIICMMKSSTSAGGASNSASADCRHCKGTFNADSLSLQRKKCMHRPTKCPDYVKIIAMKMWLNELECQQERPEAGKKHKENSENTGVNASTQTEEKKTEDITHLKGAFFALKNTKDNIRFQLDSLHIFYEACVSGSSTTHHEKEVLHDFKELFLQKEDCDVVIKVKGSEFPAHRFVLKARSPVFASTFRHNMKESATGIVEIEDCDPSSFLDFLCFLYCGDVGMISRENAISLFTAADKYEVLGLKAECLDFLKKNITVDTFCETITLALQHSETELIALATNFFVRHAEEILLTVKWQTFAAENPTQSNELFIKFVRSVKH